MQAAKLRPVDIVVDVKFSGLKNLCDENTENLHLYTGDKSHPSEVSHYGNGKMISCLLELDKEFGKALRAGEFDTVDPESGKIIPPKVKKIWVNDISLPWGGRFKIEGSMNRKGYHAEHKWGDTVDISYNHDHGINSKQKYWIKKEGRRIFNSVPLDHNNHFHIAAVEKE